MSKIKRIILKVAEWVTIFIAILLMPLIYPLFLVMTAIFDESNFDRRGDNND